MLRYFEHTLYTKCSVFKAQPVLVLMGVILYYFKILRGGGYCSYEYTNHDCVTREVKHQGQRGYKIPLQRVIDLSAIYRACVYVI